jgi:hypothetical protein
MSSIRATTISDLAGTGPATLTGQYAAKAWVNFNGNGTVAIRESGNVSSITDNGAGNYTANFSNALTDANYSFSLGVQRDISAFTFALVATVRLLSEVTATSLRVQTGQKDSTASSDVESCCITITR